MVIEPLKDANIDLVELKSDDPRLPPTPHCKLHGAMNKLTKEGIWRCVATYRVERGPGLPPQGRVIENVCKAGCMQVDL